MFPPQMLKMMQQQAKQGMTAMPAHEPPPEGTAWMRAHLDGMAAYNMASLTIKKKTDTLGVLPGNGKEYYMPSQPSDVIASNSFAHVEVQPEAAEQQEQLAKAS